MAKKKKAKNSARRGTAPEGDNQRRFHPSDLDWSVIARPLLKQLEEADERTPIDVVIDLNFRYEEGLAAAKQRTIDLIREITEDIGSGESSGRVGGRKKELSRQHLFASLKKVQIEELAKRSFYAEQEEGEKEERPLPFIRRPVFMIWPDFTVRALTLKSISTVKADAAHRAFSAGGDGIVWAVLDSGIEEHPHFRKHHNLAVGKLDSPLEHRNFAPPPEELRAELENWEGSLDQLRAKEWKLRRKAEEGKGNGNLTDVAKEREQVEAHIRELEEVAALTDELGHGTHVAGIIAGEREAGDLEENKGRNDSSGDETGKEEKTPLRACSRRRDERGNTQYRSFEFEKISGMAPRCKILSIKVLDEKGEGPVSNLLAAIAEIQEINEHGRWLKIHGVNLSVGYDFEPEWFACGQSPLCVEVDRLVKSGVIVVTAAGNTGFGYNETASARGVVASGMMMTINDPGNSDQAITVGSTHREMPHAYGVSFFSSKGPTGDGRLKPDLVAPGERIISCAAGRKQEEAARGLAGEEAPEYTEDSGTSMAAPHVSGAIAAFLSIRREFIGRPERVKEIFVSNTTDLKRERYLQGNGLVDLMRAIQAV